MIVRHVSENLHVFLGHKWEQVVGKHVSALIEGFTATYESVQAFEVERTAAFTHFTGVGLCSGALRSFPNSSKKGPDLIASSLRREPEAGAALLPPQRTVDDCGAPDTGRHRAAPGPRQTTAADEDHSCVQKCEPHQVYV